MKKIIQQIKENEPVSVTFMTCIVGVCAVCVLFIAGAALLTIWNRPIPVNHDITYGADPVWIAEQKRLLRKHGENHIIIYEQGKTPYYYCGRNKDKKCSLI